MSESTETAAVVAAPNDDLYATPPADFAGWYIVDALDGRRWLGKIVAHHHTDSAAQLDGIPLLADEVVLQPAFEMFDDKLTYGFLEPKMGIDPKTMQTGVTGMEPKAIGMNLFEFNTILSLKKLGLPRQRVRRSGLCAISEWSADRRRELRRALGNFIPQQAPELPEALKAASNGSREKVR